MYNDFTPKIWMTETKRKEFACPYILHPSMEDKGYFKMIRKEGRLDACKKDT